MNMSRITIDPLVIVVVILASTTTKKIKKMCNVTIYLHFGPLFLHWVNERPRELYCGGSCGSFENFWSSMKVRGAHPW
jgi:hypothetical protein